MKRKIHSRTLVVLLSMLFIIGLTPVTALANTSTGIKVNGVDAGQMKTNLGGKLSLSVELDANSCVPVKVTRL